MRISFRLHKSKFLLLLLPLVGITLACINLSEVKPFTSIDWLDVLAEGGTSAAVAIWAVIILSCRPAGRVTNHLFGSLALVFTAFWFDMLDEFLRLSLAGWLAAGFESIVLPLGVAWLTWALYLWRGEQLAINSQLQKREQLLRDHLHLDELTQIGGAKHLKSQLSWYFDRPEVQPLTLVMLEVDAYQAFTRSHGYGEADRLLISIAELMLLNMRSQDLLCRYAANRFALILPKTDAAHAHQLVTEIQNAVATFAFKVNGETTCFQNLNAACVQWQLESEAELIAKVQHQLAMHIRFQGAA